MDSQHLIRAFARMGARARVGSLQLATRHVWTGQVQIDIEKDRQGEFFDIRMHPSDPPNLLVADVQSNDRHLLLMSGRSRFLCGHDERHWFVAAVPEHASVASVRQAREALMPVAVHEALDRNRVRRRLRHRRRNAAFLRQGEWFFLPDPDVKVDEKLILRNEPLRRGRGKPHMAQFAYRSGGETVYVSHVAPKGFSEATYRRWLRDNPRRGDVVWSLMRRNPTVHVRGTIRHPDHKTIELRQWHRVEMNTETQSLAMRNVAFLD